MHLLLYLSSHCCLHRALNEHTNFERFWTAALTLFKVATNDNWTDVMVGCMIGVRGRCLVCVHVGGGHKLVCRQPPPPTQEGHAPAPQ